MNGCRKSATSFEEWNQPSACATMCKSSITIRKFSLSLCSCKQSLRQIDMSCYVVTHNGMKSAKADGACDACVRLEKIGTLPHCINFIPGNLPLGVQGKTHCQASFRPTLPLNGRGTGRNCSRRSTSRGLNQINRMNSYLFGDIHCWDVKGRID